MLNLFLILLLFLDGLLSFATNEFARFFGLEVPGLLCTKIDPLLFSRDRNSYYKDSLCDVHTKYISSLSHCSIDRRLTDVHQMCDGHVLSFATKNRLSFAINESPLHVLGADDIKCSCQIQLKLAANLEEDMSNDNEKSSTCQCSSRGKPMRKQEHDESSCGSKHLSHIDYSSEIEFEVQDGDCSSAVLSEKEINYNEKIAESPNTMMSRGTDGVQEEQLLRIESRQVSLSEPYEVLDGDCDARENRTISALSTVWKSLATVL